MIIVMKMSATDDEVQRVVDRVAELGFSTHLSRGVERTIIGVIGDERRLNREMFELMDGVEKILDVLPPFKLASKDFKPDGTVIPLNGVRIGDRAVAVMAGPCAVEDRAQMREVAHAIKEMGVKILRAGAFKPRTSPYSFQGLGQEGLEILAEVREEFGLAIVTEVIAPEDVPMVSQYADILQVGARNMQNYRLLHTLGANGKPVLLKRGLMSTLQELLMSAEYILSHGNYQVMLCERGIRTFETYTRYTFDINAIPVLKTMTHLPIIADPSHGTGKWNLVGPIAKAAVAAGADGLLIEVHPHPEQALSDGAQSLKPETFAQLLHELQAVAQAVGREL
ncbi:MAG: 3-deoxy-7-phosphoheptulonate synthase [Anaerolineae bacterium]